MKQSDVRVWIISHAHRHSFTVESLKNPLGTTTFPIEYTIIKGEDLKIFETVSFSQ